MNPSNEPVSLMVEIGGESYPIRSTADPGEVERCARYVDECIQEIRGRSSLLDAHRGAILAALSITARYFEALDELNELRGHIIREADALAEDVGDELARYEES